ncbi:hypothetical protein DPEC_G00237960 [Dallia pectoralis]|uniref:Uncharacterized protein n=1 Tax=Dallia pectoralis TaxID=75939 RepID=A0ACC2FZ00_DALPE|nr:hypothetical protein DPEC_G00237960 [Dallia pectoralis]
MASRWCSAGTNILRVSVLARWPHHGSGGLPMDRVAEGVITKVEPGEGHLARFRNNEGKVSISLPVENDGARCWGATTSWPTHLLDLRYPVHCRSHPEP